MIRILFVLAFPVLLLGICDFADAKCGGGSARGRLAERRAMRRAPMMMSYSRSTTTMQAAPACQSCAPAQMPKEKKK